MNSATGVIGENSIHKDADINMMWETGLAAVAKEESVICNYN
jgi:hypothetical protein